MNGVERGEGVLVLRPVRLAGGLCWIEGRIVSIALSVWTVRVLR